MTLKNKEIIFPEINGINFSGYENKDVKKAVSEFENYLTDRQDFISKNIENKTFSKLDIIILIESIDKKHKKIFGDFEK
jgi:hypothetical protein